MSISKLTSASKGSELKDKLNEAIDFVNALSSFSVLDSDSGTISLTNSVNQTFTIAGGSNISTSVAGTTLTVALDTSITGITALTATTITPTTIAGNPTLSGNIIVSGTSNLIGAVKFGTSTTYFTFPTTAGSVGEFLKLTGTNTVGWAAGAGGAVNYDDLADVLNGALSYSGLGDCIQYVNNGETGIDSDTDFTYVSSTKTMTVDNIAVRDSQTVATQLLVGSGSADTIPIKVSDSYTSTSHPVTGIFADATLAIGSSTSGANTSYKLFGGSLTLADVDYNLIQGIVMDITVGSGVTEELDNLYLFRSNLTYNANPTVEPTVGIFDVYMTFTGTTTIDYLSGFSVNIQAGAGDTISNDYWGYRHSMTVPDQLGGNLYGFYSDIGGADGQDAVDVYGFYSFIDAKFASTNTNKKGFYSEILFNTESAAADLYGFESVITVDGWGCGDIYGIKNALTLDTTTGVGKTILMQFDFTDTDATHGDTGAFMVFNYTGAAGATYGLNSFYGLDMNMTVNASQTFTNLNMFDISLTTNAATVTNTVQGIKLALNTGSDDCYGMSISLTSTNIGSRSINVLTDHAVQLATSLIFTSLTADQTLITLNPSEMSEYIRNGKKIIKYNDAGTVRYWYLDLTATTNPAPWVYTITPP